MMNSEKQTSSSIINPIPDSAIRISEALRQNHGHEVSPLDDEYAEDRISDEPKYEAVKEGCLDTTVQPG